MDIDFAIFYETFPVFQNNGLIKKSLDFPIIVFSLLLQSYLYAGRAVFASLEGTVSFGGIYKNIFSERNQSHLRILI
jgi:hypothetical protein